MRELWASPNPKYMTPANDNVIIKQLPPSDTTKGGIVIPPQANERQQNLLGEVLHIGPGALNESTGERRAMTARVGQTVLFSKFAGTGLLLDGEPCLLMQERHILVYLD